MQLANEQNGNEDGSDDDDATHGRHPFLGCVIWVDGLIALGLDDFFAFQHLDEPVAEPYRDDQSQNDGRCGTEGDVVEDACAWKVALLQIIEEIV